MWTNTPDPGLSEVKVHHERESPACRALVVERISINVY